MYDYFSIKFTFLYYLHGDLVGPGVIVVAGIVGFMCGCRNRCTTKSVATTAVCIFSSMQVSPSLMHKEPSGHVSVELKD